MRFEFNSSSGTFKYKDSPRVEQIQKKYNKYKNETETLYGKEKLREIVTAFILATSSHHLKGEYSINTQRFLAGLNAVEEKLGIKEEERTTLKSLDEILKNS